jgi:predicted RNase H-like HicB family nuclease
VESRGAEDTLTKRFAISVAWDDYGHPIGCVPALGDCMATGRDMEEMLDQLEEEVKLRLIDRGETSADIELVGGDIWIV